MFKQKELNYEQKIKRWNKYNTITNTIEETVIEAIDDKVLLTIEWHNNFKHTKLLFAKFK